MAEGKLPIEVAQRIAEEHSCWQVIVVAWDGNQTHVVTYGVSEDDSEQAAQGGNFVKTALGWPEELCNTESTKTIKLRAQIDDLQSRNSHLEGELERVRASLNLSGIDYPPDRL